MGVALQVHFTVIGSYSMLKDIALQFVWIQKPVKNNFSSYLKESFSPFWLTHIFWFCCGTSWPPEMTIPKEVLRDIISKTGTVIIPIPDGILPNRKFMPRGLGRDATQSIGLLHLCVPFVCLFPHRNIFGKTWGLWLCLHPWCTDARGRGCRDSRVCAVQTVTAQRACWARPLRLWQQTWHSLGQGQQIWHSLRKWQQVRCPLGPWQQIWRPLGQWQQTWCPLQSWQNTWRPRGWGSVGGAKAVWVWPCPWSMPLCHHGGVASGAIIHSGRGTILLFFSSGKLLGAALGTLFSHRCPSIPVPSSPLGESAVELWMLLWSSKPTSKEPSPSQDGRSRAEPKPRGRVESSQMLPTTMWTVWIVRCCWSLFSVVLGSATGRASHRKCPSSQLQT